MIIKSGSSVVDGYASAVIRVLWGKNPNNVIVRRIIKFSLKINIRTRAVGFNLTSHVYHIFDNSRSVKSHHLSASLILCFPLLRTIQKAVTMKSRYNYKRFSEVAMSVKPIKARPFWQEFLIVMGITSSIVVFLSLIFGFSQLSNFFFYGTIVLLIISIIPMFSDFGTRRKALREVKKQGKFVKIDFSDDHLEKVRRGNRITFVYGLSAILTFILSILTTGLWN